MRHTRQGPRWWNVWLPLMLLLFGGLLLLEPQGPLSPAGHSIVQAVLALLMYGAVVIWLRYNRGALLNKEYEREQAQGRASMARQPRQEPIIHDDEPWDEVWLPRDGVGGGAPLSWRPVPRDGVGGGGAA
jgi:hypothetical protein